MADWSSGFVEIVRQTTSTPFLHRIDTSSWLQLRAVKVRIEGI